MTHKAPSTMDGALLPSSGAAEACIRALLTRNAARFGPLPALQVIVGSTTYSLSWGAMLQAATRGLDVFGSRSGLLGDALPMGTMWAELSRLAPGERILVSSNDPLVRMQAGLAQSLASGASLLMFGSVAFVERLKRGRPTFVLADRDDWEAFLQGVPSWPVCEDDPVAAAAGASALGLYRAAIGLDACRMAASSGGLSTRGVRVLAAMGIPLLNPPEGLPG